MECSKHNVCYNLLMSSNDRYRGNREYRDLTVQTHYKTPGRSTRVQTKGTTMNDLSFSQNSVDARRPYEDTAFIERSRQQQRARQPQKRPYAQQPQRAQQQHPQQHDSVPPYARDPYPQRYYQKPQPVSAAPAPVQDKSAASKEADKAAKAARIEANSKPKVSKEVALQIEMIFKIGIMVWGAAALVTVIVLLSGS